MAGEQSPPEDLRSDGVVEDAPVGQEFTALQLQAASLGRLTTVMGPGSIITPELVDAYGEKGMEDVPVSAERL